MSHGVFQSGARQRGGAWIGDRPAHPLDGRRHGTRKKEIALAKAEARGALRDVKMSVAPFAIAASVLLAGVLTLVATAVLALSEVMEPWLAALIVSAVLLVTGWILLKAGQRKWPSIGERLDRTQGSLKKDATVVARRT